MTGTARSARVWRAPNGSPTARPNCCRSPYFHVVFTVPAPIAAIALQNKAVVYDILLQGGGRDDPRIGADPKHLGAETGMIAIRHTWGQTLTHHPHVHCIVLPGGGLGAGWAMGRLSANVFLPVHVPVAPLSSSVP